MHALLLTLLLAPPAAAQEEGSSPHDLVILGSLLAVCLLVIPTTFIKLVALRDRRPTRCPQCLQDDARPARAHALRDPLLAIVGLSAYRCRACKRRYYAGQPRDAQRRPSRRSVPTRVAVSAIEREPESEVGVASEAVSAVAPVAEKRIERKRRKEGSNDLAWIVSGTVAVLVTIGAVIWVRIAQRPAFNLVVGQPASGSKGSDISKGARATPIPPTPQLELSVSEASFVTVGNGRRIRGLVRNAGKLPYRNVEIVIETDGRDSQVVRTVSATVPALNPGASVSFETEPVPPEALQYRLKEITGEKVATPSPSPPR